MQCVLPLRSKASDEDSVQCLLGCLGLAYAECQQAAGFSWMDLSLHHACSDSAAHAASDQYQINSDSRPGLME